MSIDMKSNRHSRSYFTTPHSAKGFTLIELLVVIAIMGLLASIVYASVNNARNKAKVAAGQQFDASVYHVVGPNLVANLEFNDCSGTIASDSSNNNNTGTLVNGPTWSTDTPTGTGCSLSLSGFNYVNMGTKNVFMNPTGFTWSIWFNGSNLPTSGSVGRAQELMSTADGGGCEDVYFGFGSETTAPQNSLAFNIDGLGGCVARDSALYYQGSFSSGKWYHAVAVRDFVKNTVSIYVNGALVASKTSTGIPITRAMPLYLGEIPIYGAYFPGLIDNVRIYASVLSVSEIQKLYAMELPKHLVLKK
jgi:prepilin-type N-terminal cleavage/methylation domain-containing protein